MAEQVLVTGGLGLLGRAVVDDLHDHGYRVVILDRALVGDLPDGVRSVRGDVTDVGQVAGLLEGCDALVHLAAIPVPVSDPAEIVFRGNTGGTFAALQAASLMGIRRVALASSGSAYGTAWSRQPTHVQYVPVDEDHPLLVEDPYGLSKEVDERIAEMFCRRDQMSIAALRFHWVMDRAGQLSRHQGQRAGEVDLEELRNLWGYVDIRDAARACRLAIEVARDRPYGFQPMNIAAADTIAAEPIEELLRRNGPDIEVRQPITGSQGAYSIDRAKEILGWEPQFSWRD